MIQIISFPSHDFAVDPHKQGLKDCGKTYWVGLKMDAYLKAAGEPFSPPELMIVDYDNLAYLKRMASDKSRYKFFRKVPAIVVVDSGCQPDMSLIPHFNVIGIIPIETQYKPENLGKLLQAFDAAKSQAGGKVTYQAFQKSLAAIAAQRAPINGAARPPIRHGGSVSKPGVQ